MSGSGWFRVLGRGSLGRCVAGPVVEQGLEVGVEIQILKSSMWSRSSSAHEDPAMVLGQPGPEDTQVLFDVPLPFDQ